MWHRRSRVPTTKLIRLGGRRGREGVGSLTPNISKEVSIIATVSMFGAQIIDHNVVETL